MLPPGHLAAGYLATKLSIQALLPLYPQADQLKFWIVGIASSFFVDLDVFVTFLKIGRPVSGTKGVNHRMDFTHAPSLHVSIALIGFVLSILISSSDLQLYAILYCIGTLTHFILDSTYYGIMWAWPFSHKLYALRNAGVDSELPQRSVLAYWKTYFGLYIRKVEFYIELLFLIIAIYYFLTPVKII